MAQPDPWDDRLLRIQRERDRAFMARVVAGTERRRSARLRTQGRALMRRRTAPAPLVALAEEHVREAPDAHFYRVAAERERRLAGVARDAARTAQAHAGEGGLARETHREAARLHRHAVELHERYARFDEETADTKDARRH